MLWFIGRRTAIALPTLVAISFIIFAILDLAPGDPTSHLPLTIPADVREQIRETMGVNDPFLVKWFLWVKQVMIHEPISLIGEMATARHVVIPHLLARVLRDKRVTCLLDTQLFREIEKVAFDAGHLAQPDRKRL